jgi:adenylate kinase
MKLLFIGSPGSGKGTLAKIISKQIKIPHISTGEMLREVTGKIKKQIDEAIKNGNLISDSLTLEILKQRLSKTDCKNGFILEGFPRNISQLELLESISDIDKVFEISVSDNEAIKRISGRVLCENCKEGYNELTQPKPKVKGICDKCGGKLIKRPDDNENIVKKRLNHYHKETEPILQKYKDKLIKINGEQTIEKITNDILKELK